MTQKEVKSNNFLNDGAKVKKHPSVQKHSNQLQGENLEQQQEEITILHFSDIHYSIVTKDDSSETRLRQVDVKKTLNALVKYIKEEQKKVDIIVITGDIANKGSFEEYREFHEVFLAKLLLVTKLTIDNVVMCPGNHDIVSKELVRKGWRLEYQPLDTIDRLVPYSEVFAGYIRYQKKFGFTEFENKIGEKYSKHDKTSRDQLSFLKTLCGYRQIKGIDFISMNSAWYCRTSDWDSLEGIVEKDFEKLTIGTPFLKDAIEILKLKHESTTSEAENDNMNENKYSIMLLHHPFFFDTLTADLENFDPRLILNPHVKDYTHHKHRRYVSCLYQWLNPEEIFINCGLPGEPYGENTSIISDPDTGIEKHINLILCGHLHKKENPLLVGRNGTVGLIGGAICTAAVSGSKDVKEPFCRFITINKKTTEQKINEYKYNKEEKRWTLDNTLGVGKTSMIFMPAKIIKEMMNLNLDMKQDHLKEKFTILNKDAIKKKVKGEQSKNQEEEI